MTEKFEPGKSYYLPLDQIITGPFQLRDQIGGESFEELKASLAERGQLQPVVVNIFQGSTTDAKVPLLIGHRRLEAAKALGWDKIWCTPVYGAGDFDNVAAVLVENLQRQNLAPLEEAKAIKKLMDSLILSGPGLSKDDIMKLTQEDIAKALGKRQPYVSEMMQIASLTDEEISKLSDSDKLKKEKLLQMVKSRNFDRKPAAGRPASPFNYKFDGDVLSIRGKVNLKTDDVSVLLAKLKELIAKLEERKPA